MSIADKLLTVAENEQKIHDEVVGQSDLIAQIKAKVNSLPEAGGGEKLTLFAPTIALNSVSSELTITDNRNGGFVQGYNLYANDELVTVLTSKEVTLADYIEHTETIDIKVQAVGANFNPSDYAVVTWEYVNVAGTAGLTYEIRYDGISAQCKSLGDAIETDIEIASQYEGLPVTRIGHSAFKGCSNLTSVTIPKSVTYIDYYAFENCSSLTRVAIPDSVTHIDSYAFYGCSSLTSLVLSDNVTWIGDEVFRKCSSLKSVVIGNSIQKIGSSAFRECYGLKNVVIGNSVTSINIYAFYQCYNLKRVDFSTHTSVPSLNNSNAFTNAHSTLQIKVPASLIDEWKAATNWSNYADKIVTEFTNTL